jgi:hypothetical protein
MGRDGKRYIADLGILKIRILSQNGLDRKLSGGLLICPSGSHTARKGRDEDVAAQKKAAALVYLSALASI